MTATCSYNIEKGIEGCLMGATLHFLIANARSAEYWIRVQIATAQIVSSDASANKGSSVFPFAALKYFIDACFS